MRVVYGDGTLKSKVGAHIVVDVDNVVNSVIDVHVDNCITIDTKARLSYMYKFELMRQKHEEALRHPILQQPHCRELQTKNPIVLKI